LLACCPCLNLFATPLIGRVSLVLVLATLVGGLRLPWGLPGAFAAVLAGSAIFWGRWLLGAGDAHPAAELALALAPPWPTLAWVSALDQILAYLPLALPFAVATVVG